MKRLATGVLLLVFVVPAAFAARSSAPAPSSRAERSPQQVAEDELRQGAQQLDRAAKLHAELQAAPADKREGLQKKLNKTLEGAARNFEKATMNAPRMVQAYSELGFALRKLGRYEESLAAYDKALTIVPNYAPALEYRAEAYLGLNRVAEAKEAYLILFGGDRPRADLLFAAMQKWVAARTADPAGVDPQQVAELAKFVEERAAIHAQTSVATASKDLRTW